MKYSSTTGKYGYTAGANSVFTRKITMQVVNVNETKISSTVSWVQGSGTPPSVTLSENLYNWVE